MLMDSVEIVTWQMHIFFFFKTQDLTILLQIVFYQFFLHKSKKYRNSDFYQ